LNTKHIPPHIGKPPPPAWDGASAPMRDWDLLRPSRARPRIWPANREGRRAAEQCSQRPGRSS